MAKDSMYDSSWDEWRDEELARDGIDEKLESDEVRAMRGLDFTRRSVANRKMSPEDGIRAFLDGFDDEPTPHSPYDDLTPEELEAIFPPPTDEELDDMYHYHIESEARIYGVKNVDSVSFEVLEKTVEKLAEMEKEGKIERGKVYIPGMKIMATEDGPKVYPEDWKEPVDYDTASEFSSDEELNASYDQMLFDLDK